MKPALSAAAALVLSATLAAQTAIKPPKNKYKPEDDVKLGREAAAEVRKQLPVIENGQINDYLASMGRELVAQAPPELNHPEFEYSFKAVNLKDINAFALPGGPMFVNRGMVEAATTEGQVAGVMAHELAHVLLRHGTANATKAQNAQLGALAGAIAGAVIGGRVGTAVQQGSQFGLGTLAAQVQPRIREAGRPPGRADDGARRLRPERSGPHVRDDREAGQESRRSRVAERPPEPG